MKPISGNEFQRMRDIQFQAMSDICKIGAYSESFDTLGDIVKVWNFGDFISCGVKFHDGEKKFGEVVETDTLAVIRLPYGTQIDSQDHIYLDRTETEYSVNNIKNGITCVLVEVKRIEV